MNFSGIGFWYYFRIQCSWFDSGYTLMRHSLEHWASTCGTLPDHGVLAVGHGTGFAGAVRLEIRTFFYDLPSGRSCSVSVDTCLCVSPGCLWTISVSTWRRHLENVGVFSVIGSTMGTRSWDSPRGFH